MPTSAPPDAFAFGSNWQRYVAHYLTPERVEEAKRSLADLAGPLENRSFLDIGAGSGLFSLAAYQLGARPVVSFDVDPQSVASCRNLRAGVEGWTVEQASILDPSLDVEPAEVVYSWGVLHHTGDMWTAIQNAARLVGPGGLFVIALYNAGHSRLLTVERWRAIKRFYNRLPRLGKRAMEGLYLLYHAQGALRRRSLREVFHRGRGMDVRTDISDWLGGYPYEAATVDEVTDFVTRLDFDVVRVVPDDPAGFSNNEFVFRRR